MYLISLHIIYLNDGELPIFDQFDNFKLNSCNRKVIILYNAQGVLVTCIVYIISSRRIDSKNCIQYRLKKNIFLENLTKLLYTHLRAVKRI